ncbi:MAG: PLDc N-terminal domain-containing protein [Geobacteraceae bacterium]|nr:PLDc N-terminal domain-containing protein [Geobacteraceae bacterium]
MHDFGMMGMMGVMALAAVFFFWLVAVAAFVFWLWALIDLLRSEFTGSNKIVWLLTVILLPLLGAVLYWFIGREQKIGEEGGDTPPE